VGAPGPNLYIASEVKHNQFSIAGGNPGMKVSWQVTGIRHDAYAQHNRIPVEELKVGDERGRYLDPKDYGLSEEMGVPSVHSRAIREKFEKSRRDAEARGKK
jgi:hypothetical protein